MVDIFASRHRHTFFFEENALDAFTEDTIQILGKHAVRVRNFSGIREWKVITTPEELIKVVKAVCSFDNDNIASYWNIVFLIANNTAHRLKRKLDITRPNRVWNPNTLLPFQYCPCTWDSYRDLFK